MSQLISRNEAGLSHKPGKRPETMRVLYWDIDIALLLEPLKHREEGLQAQQGFYFTSSQRVPAGPD